MCLFSYTKETIKINTSSHLLILNQHCVIASPLTESVENTDMINNCISQDLIQLYSSHILVTKRKEYSADGIIVKLKCISWKPELGL